MKNIKCLLACGMLLCLLVGCAVYIPREYPEEGIWYCEELEIYLDMSDHTGVYLDDSGVFAPLFVQIDYGTGFFINYCEYEWSENYLKDGYHQATDFEYKNGVLRLTDRATKQVYEFIEVDRELFPEE